jgi:hypothetical protein
MITGGVLGRAPRELREGEPGRPVEGISRVLNPIRS